MISKQWIERVVLPEFVDHCRMFETLLLKEWLGLPGNHLEELSALLTNAQNEDGGFPSCFEPDTRSKRSSIIGTVRAMDLFAEMGSIPTEVTEKLIQYFISTFDSEYQGWKILSADVSDSPRAIWWNEDQFGLVNPNAEIVALFTMLDIDIPSLPLMNLLKRILRKRNVSEMHDYQCMTKLFKVLKKPFTKSLIQSGMKSIQWDESEWKAYGLGPSDVIDSPQHPLYITYKEEVDKHLSYLVTSLIESKRVMPTWKWWQFEESFEEAKQEWSGVLTLALLRKLKRFNKISD